MPLLTALESGAIRAPIVVAGHSMPADSVMSAAWAVNQAVAGCSRVAVHATVSMTTVVAVVGALAAGVQVVPVPADAGGHERQHILADAEPQAWLGEAPKAGAGPLPVIPVDLAAKGDALPALAADDEVALILYTSGTTGPPKGVMLSRRAIAAGIDALADAWHWDSSDILAHGLPLFHVHGLVLGVLGPLRLGSGLIHVGRPTPQAYAAALEAGATLFFGVPTIWGRVAASPDHARRLAAARLLVSGSAALPAPVAARMHELTGHTVLERYGMSETLITVAARADSPSGQGLVGVPVAGVQTRLVDERGALVDRDGESIGRLEVRGPTLFNGYLGRPHDTAAAFTADGWFRTGDVATINAKGEHRIVGRESSDLIKTGGYRVGAGEVESALLEHPAVAECAVIARADDDLGQVIAAYVVRSGRLEVSEEDLTHWVAEHLSVHKRPRVVVFVASLPRNEMGKVQKSRLGD